MNNVKESTPHETHADIETASSALNNALRALRLYQASRILLRDIPTMKGVLLDFSAYMLNVVPDEDGASLLRTCLAEGMSRYASTDGGTDVKMAAFIRGLLLHSPRMMKHKLYVCVNGSTEVWQPFVKPLDAWLNEHSAHFPYRFADEPYAYVDEQSFRLMLASRILTLRDVAMLGGSIQDIL